MAINYITKDLNNYAKILGSFNKLNWVKAMDIEIKDLFRQNIWKLIIPLLKTNILKGQWVYKTKLDKDNNIIKYKAKQVTKGFQQKYGINFNKTFSNIVKPMVYRILFAIVAYLNLYIEQCDIKSTFPNVLLNEEIYIIQLIGFKNKTNKICLLNKALYDLK